MKQFESPRIQLAALVLAAAILAGLAVFAMVQSDNFATPQASPELRQFFDRCANVRTDMSEYEIDVLFREYASAQSDDPKTEDVGKETFPRPPTLMKWYQSIANPADGTWYIKVYFDKNGRVVGKQFAWTG